MLPVLKILVVACTCVSLVYSSQYNSIDTSGIHDQVDNESIRRSLSELDQIRDRVTSKRRTTDRLVEDVEKQLNQDLHNNKRKEDLMRMSSKDRLCERGLRHLLGSVDRVHNCLHSVERDNRHKLYHLKKQGARFEVLSELAVKSNQEKLERCGADRRCYDKVTSKARTDLQREDVEMETIGEKAKGILNQTRYLLNTCHRYYSQDITKANFECNRGDADDGGVESSTIGAYPISSQGVDYYETTTYRPTTAFVPTTSSYQYSTGSVVADSY